MYEKENYHWNECYFGLDDLAPGADAFGAGDDPYGTGDDPYGTGAADPYGANAFGDDPFGVGAGGLDDADPYGLGALTADDLMDPGIMDEKKRCLKLSSSESYAWIQGSVRMLSERYC